jgi:lipopolysaccharide transport system ATP-binding protein
LKILARITEPTEGYAQIWGKTSSLLEVGTGFHQELTGRENIYLNGSILGMQRSEIKAKFDQIVDFSGVHRFIDTQVKHYSSGMRVRLAFSVAAHLQPEILFIDEVLAVGDLEFQQKCLSKMKEIANAGRTVILVSHNLAAIKEMCQTCILLDHGELKYFGPVAEGLAQYSASMVDDDVEETFHGGWWKISISAEKETEQPVSSDQPFTVEGRLDLEEDYTNATLICSIKDSAGNFVILEKISANQLISGKIRQGRYRVRIEVPVVWLAPGVYVLLFRFHGHTEAGIWKRFTSAQTIFTVTGAFRGIDHSRILLHPQVRWSLNSKAVMAGPLAD